jgi:tRNA G37 N-methylase TrmD
MQSIIKTRSLVQIRTHAQKVFKKVEDKKTSGAIGMASEVGVVKITCMP